MSSIVLSKYLPVYGGIILGHCIYGVATCKNQTNVSITILNRPTVFYKDNQARLAYISTYAVTGVLCPLLYMPMCYSYLWKHTTTTVNIKEPKET
jgi:hypothetical protein